MRDLSSFVLYGNDYKSVIFLIHLTIPFSRKDLLMV